MPPLPRGMRPSVPVENYRQLCDRPQTNIQRTNHDKSFMYVRTYISQRYVNLFRQCYSPNIRHDIFIILCLSVISFPGKGNDSPCTLHCLHFVDSHVSVLEGMFPAMLDTLSFIFSSVVQCGGWYSCFAADIQCSITRANFLIF